MLKMGNERLKNFQSASTRKESHLRLQKFDHEQEEYHVQRLLKKIWWWIAIRKSI